MKTFTEFLTEDEHPMAAEKVIPNSPDLIHRGMSEREYNNYREKKEIKSSGNGNVGKGEHGLTFFSAHPRVAASYAQLNSSIDKRPAYVVTIKRPKAISLNRDDGFELGLSKPVKSEDVHSIYQGQKAEGKWQWKKHE